MVVEFHGAAILFSVEKNKTNSFVSLKINLHQFPEAISL